MEVIKQQNGDVLEVSVKGRLDNYWSEYLAEQLNAAVNDGAHNMRIDLSEVNYLSSAGIGVLLRIYRQLRAIQGTFVIGQASERVRSVLRLVALEPILFGTADRVIPTAATSPAQTLEMDEGTIDVYQLTASGPMECQLIGDPNLICGGSASAVSCASRQMSDSAIALGIGALGADFEDCRGSFGEFVAIAGCCAYLPTDRTSVPDYLVSTERFVPEVQVLYGIECHGGMGQLLRFECRPDARMPLYQVARRCLEISGATTVAIAMLAEASNVVGATLRFSPAVAPARMDYPSIRDWITFLPVAAGVRNTLVVGGVASREPWPALAPFLRPLDRCGDLGGHFHAALFPHRPIQRGFLDLAATIHNTFQSQGVASVVHLLNDYRPITGAGETTFVRGACWIAPLDPCPRATS